MVKNFKGQVKISEVQKGFTTLVNRINRIISIYNSSGEVQDIDYTVGDSALGSSGYTLTIGGLKQVMKSMDGIVIGAKGFKIPNTDSVKMSDGILISKNKFYRLPDSVLNIPEGVNEVTVYFNTLSGEYEYTRQSVDTTIEEEVPALDLRTLEDGSYILEYNSTTNSKKCCVAQEIIGKSEVELFRGITDANTNIVNMTVDVPYLGSKEYQVLTGDSNLGTGFNLSKLPHCSKELGKDAFNLKFLATNSDEYRKTLNACGYIMGYYYKENEKEFFIPFIASNCYNNGVTDNGALRTASIVNPNGISMKMLDIGQIVTTEQFVIPPYNSGYADDENYGGGILLDQRDTTIYNVIDPAWLWEVKEQGRHIYTAQDSANAISTEFIYEDLRVGDSIPPGVTTQTILGRWINNQHETVYKTSIQGKVPIDKITSRCYGLDANGQVIKTYSIRNANAQPLPTVIAGVRQNKGVITLDNYETRVDTGVEYNEGNRVIEACNMIIYACSDFYDKTGNVSESARLKPSLYSPRFDTGTTTVSSVVKDYPDPSGYFITTLNPNRKSGYTNNLKNTQVEDIYGRYSINIVDNALDNKIYSYNGKDADYYEINTDTAENAKFIAGMEGNNAIDNKNNYYRLFFNGTQVSSNSQNGHRVNAFVNMVNFLYVPRGVKSPYTVEGRNVTRGFDVEENLTLLDDDT